MAWTTTTRARLARDGPDELTAASPRPSGGNSSRSFRPSWSCCSSSPRPFPPDCGCSRLPAPRIPRPRHRVERALAPPSPPAVALAYYHKWRTHLAVSEKAVPARSGYLEPRPDEADRLSADAPLVPIVFLVGTGRAPRGLALPALRHHARTSHPSSTMRSSKPKSCRPGSPSLRLRRGAPISRVVHGAGRVSAIQRRTTPTGSRRDVISRTLSGVAVLGQFQRDPVELGIESSRLGYLLIGPPIAGTSGRGSLDRHYLPRMRVSSASAHAFGPLRVLLPVSGVSGHATPQSGGLLRVLRLRR